MRKSEYILRKFGEDLRKRREDLSNTKTTITQIAAEFGVSPSTVSRALNALPGVSESLRKKIVDRAGETGYIPKTRLKDLSKENIIAIMGGDIRNPFYAQLIYTAQRKLNEKGYLVAVFNSEYDESDELKYISLAEKNKFAGIIQVAVPSEHLSVLLNKLSTPVVMVNRMLETVETDVVLLDNYEAGYIATRYLIELGHKRIGMLKGHKESSASSKRYDAYLQAMKNFNLQVNDEYLLQGDLSMETAYELAGKMFSSCSRPPSAMIVSNDIAALGFMKYCSENAVRVPEDISIVSFDNISFSETSMVPLTTVDAHATKMGSVAAELLINRINHPDNSITKIILKPELRERGSAAFNNQEEER